MKDASTEYQNKEEAVVRKPLELYKLWCGIHHWHYTNGDVPIVLEDDSLESGQSTGDSTGLVTYQPATISRGAVQYDTTMDVNTIKITFASVTDPTVQFIAMNPVAIVWIEISRVFQDQDPIEKSVLFIGQLKRGTIKGNSMEIEAVSFEHFLKMPVPRMRYQLNCNHQVFDEGCGLLQADYDVSAAITMDATKTILTSSTFSGFTAGYFTGGLAVFGEESRTIVAHTGNTITLQYRFLDLLDNDTLTVYPGCDGKAETCRDKFDNILHFLGFPFIPDENPASRVPK